MRGNLTVNTDGCYLHNVDIRGNGGASVTVESFLLNAYRVTFDNCKCSSRLSSVAMYGFRGSGTAAHNYTSKYVNCSAYALNCTGAVTLRGFYTCMNLSGCTVYDVDINSVASAIYGFDKCEGLSSCFVYDLNASASGAATGFHLCDSLSSCRANTIIGSVGNQATGFYGCGSLSGCFAINISGASIGYGFDTCRVLSGCQASQINGTAMLGCGFIGCLQMAACEAQGITGAVNEGFRSCSYGAAIYTDEAANTLNDWIDTVDANITNKVSTPSIWT
jgi:hypothetical protein